MGARSVYVPGYRYFGSRKAAGEDLARLAAEHCVTADHSVVLLSFVATLHPDGAALVALRPKVIRQSGRLALLFSVDSSYRLLLLRLERMTQETPSIRLSNALRQAVFNDTQQIKAGWFAAGEVRCALTGAVLEHSTCDADHAPPWTFAAIVRAWPKPSMVRYRANLEHDISLLADPALVEDFRTFHNARAVLRPLHWRLNRFGNLE